MASYGKQSKKVHSHGEVQNMLLAMDNKLGSNGKSLGDSAGPSKGAGKVKQASMSDVLAKDGQGKGKFD